MRAAVLTRRSWIEILEQKIPPTNGDEVRVRIKAGGICGSDIHYFQHYKMGDFPVAELTADQTISLPVHEFISFQQIEKMSTIIHKYYSSN